MKVRDPFFQLERIRKYVDEDIFPARIRKTMELPRWKYTENSMEEKIDDAYMVAYDDSGWKDFTLGQSWGGYDKVAWFRTKAAIPADFCDEGGSLALRAIVGPRDGGGSTAETLLYVDGHPVQAVDIWHEEAFLDPAIYQGKNTLQISLKAWSGVLDIPKVRVFKEAAMVLIDRDMDRFYFTVDTLLKCLELLKESDLRRIRMTKLLVEAFRMVDFMHYREKAFYDSVGAACEYLVQELEELARIQEIKPTVTGVGHSHIDMGWLWRFSATREKASRTFSTVLNLMRQFPEYRYMHSSPQLYRFLEKDYPEIFEAVKEKIKQGQWEITGGMWVEPDTNLPTGESLIRQFLFGKRYMKQEFGVDSRLVWLPDVFGYSGALPQIIRKSDMDYFMTTKISWNQYNHFPHDTFWWQGIDGSRVFAHFITTPENGSWYYTYNGTMEPEEITGIWENYKDRDKNDELLLAFGWGDGGGGPTKDMLERARVMKNIPGIPRVQIDTAENYFNRIYENCQKDRLGVWDGELYFEFHRGTYTSQARVKRDNRKAEVMMHDLEFLWAYGDMLAGTDTYPRDEINAMWEEMLLNQFHDVLPGSSIRQVYEDTAQIYERLREKGGNLLSRVEKKLAESIGLEENQLAVWNSTGWSRDDILLVPWSERVAKDTQFSQEGQPCIRQETEEGLLVFVKNIPAYGYTVLTCTSQCAASDDEGHSEHEVCELCIHDNVMENRFYRIIFREDGQIDSIYDKEADREVGCGQPLNVFTAFEDKPQRFDAWDIDIYYQDKPYPAPRLTKRQVISQGPVEAVLRQTFAFGSSVIRQDVAIYSDRKRIDFRTQVDWKEKQVLLRVYFPVDIHASSATYEIQCGNIERPTHVNTEWDFAKFEVCAQKWVDLSEEGYGVSLLNDCKYGHDIHGNTIAMTLIKSSVRPDETADRCLHEFTYSLYPHTGSVKQCQVQQEAMDLNLPLFSMAPKSPALDDAAAKAPGRNGEMAGSLLATDSDHIVIDTVKRAEDERAYIVRLYEYKNKKGKVSLKFSVPVVRVQETNLTERPLKECPVEENGITFSVTGYEIKTFKVKVTAEALDPQPKLPLQNSSV